jgi:hypothetical protein
MIFSKPFMCNNMPKKPEQRKSPHRSRLFLLGVFRQYLIKQHLL